MRSGNTSSKARDRSMYGALLVAYVLSRAALLWTGLTFSYSYDWQHFYDLPLLKERLWESMLYSHAFPIGMNLLVAAAHAISDSHPGVIYQALFLAISAVLTLTTAFLARALGAARWAALALAFLFSLSPAFLYFETFLHYEFPSTALLGLSALLFHRALTVGTLRRWFACFMCCAALVFFRLSFHLVWLAAIVVIAVACDRRNFRQVLIASALPLLLIVSWYAKNQVLFGFFGPSSRTGFSIAFVTTQRLTVAERKEWVKAGHLHPVSLLSVYSGVDRYAKYVKLPPPRGIAVLDQPFRANGEVNYNHLGLIRVSKKLMRGNRYYLKHRRADYLRTVRKGVRDYFNPTTRWHPHDPEGSPHKEQRKLLEPWEDLYNRVFHQLFAPPYGLYLLLFPLMVFALGSAFLTLWRGRLEGHEADKLVVLLAMNVVYVPLLSCLVTIGELERYRFLVEAPMWLLALRGGVLLAQGVRTRARVRA